MIYCVYIKPYTGLSFEYLFKTLDQAKTRVDEFYKSSIDARDTCRITCLYHKEEIEYLSPLSSYHHEYSQLMKLNHDDLVKKFLDYKEKFPSSDSTKEKININQIIKGLFGIINPLHLSHDMTAIEHGIAIIFNSQDDLEKFSNHCVSCGLISYE